MSVVGCAHFSLLVCCEKKKKRRKKLFSIHQLHFSLRETLRLKKGFARCACTFSGARAR